MSEKFYAWLILITLISVVGGAYVLAWRGRRPVFRRGASWTVALVSGLAAFFGTAAYAIPALYDFRRPEVPFWATLIGSLILWAICIGAWVVAIKFVILALRKDPSP